MPLITDLYNKLMHHHLSRQIRRFLVTGSVNTAFSYAMYVGAVVFLRADYFWAVIISWCLGVTFSYLTFRAFVFTEGDRSWRTFRKFLPTYVVLLVVNEIILFILVTLMDWNKLAAQGL